MAWNCSPSCIGSLPYKDPARAVDLILDQLTAIPFWPQLPNTGFRENMYIQYSSSLPGVRVDEVKERMSVDLSNYDPEDLYTRVLSDDVASFAMPREYFSGFYELMSRDIPADVLAIKGQITGPISLGFQMIDQNDRPVIYDEAYAEIIRKNLNMTARWQEGQLRTKGKETLIFLDEPYLSMIGTPFASVSANDVVKWTNEVLEGLVGKKGIHCCANTDWGLVMSMNIDVLSFDAYEHGHTISLYPDDVRRFLERGGAIAWGLVPNSEEKLKNENVRSLVKRAEGLFRSLTDKGIDEDLVLESSIMTPQCGLAGVEENMSAEVIRNVGRRLR